MWQRALRAPNINDLFNGGTQGFPAVSDICAGAKGVANAAFCTAQFAAAGSSPFVAPYTQVNGQSEAITYGNPTLKPETANSMIVGAVMTPTFLPDVTASIDFWRISIDKFIGPTSAPTVENQCHAAFNAVGAAAFVPFATLGQTTAASPCGFVTRQADGELIFNIPTTNQDGTLKTSGLDLQVSAQHEVADLLDESGDWGALDLNLSVEWLTEFFSGASSSSYKGKIDISSPAVFSTADIRPNYRFTTRLGYTYGDWRGVLTWEEIGGVVDNATGFGVNVRPYDKVDLAIKWNITDQYSADFIVNNLFNVDPPLGPYSLAAGINTFAETYDVLGTQMFIGLTAKL
jgi:outer membrane receptor protein involved in Fe transport